MSEPSEALWTPKELGAFLKVSRSWIYSATQKSQIPYLNIGGMLRFSPAQILAWVESKANQPPRCVE